MSTEPNEHFLRIESIFHDALQQSDDARRDFVISRCAGDEEVADDVFHLIDALEGADAFLESGSSIPGALGWSITEAGHDVGEGSVVGRFTLGRLLGTGGAGAVYEAVQENPHRRVAIKLVRVGAASPSTQRRFEYEVAILAQLHHPNIAQVFEAGRIDTTTGSIPWFAMELIEDALDILTYVETHGLDEEARLGLFQKICDAVDYGHRRGVVHRDLKPANILIDGSGRPRVIDFGVACSTDADLMLTTMQTQVGQLLGTAQYMSPEQWRANPADIDARSDVYSLGAVMFELLVGRPPHDLSSVPLAEAQRIVLQAAPQKPSSIRRDLTLDLDTMVLKALAKDPSMRYESPGDLSRDIGRYLNHEPILARPPSALYHLGLFTRRNRVVVLSLCVLAFFLSLAVGVSTSYAIEATDARNEASGNAKETDRLFEKGRRLTRWIIDDFFAQIRDIPGGTSARHSLSTQVLAYLDGLLSESSDPDFCREVATNFKKLGQLQGDTEQDNVGESRKAIVSLDRALSIYEQLSLDGNHRPLDVLEVAGILGIKAEILDDIGELAAATVSREHASSRLRRLIEQTELEDSLRQRALSQLGGVELDVAWRRMVGGDLKGVLPQLLSILKRQEGLVANSNKDVEAELSVLTAHAHLAELYMRTGEFEAAASHCAAVLKLCEAATGAASEADHYGLRAKQRLAQACVATGDVLLYTARFEDAYRNQARALAIREALVSADPGSVHAKRKLAISHQRCGDALVQLGRLDDALPHFVKDYDFAVEFAAQRPKHRVAQRAHWIGADKVGTCLYQLQRYEEAVPYIEDSLRIASRSASAPKPDLIDLQGVAQAHTSLGTIMAVSDESPEGMAEASVSLIAAEAQWAAIEALGQLTTQQAKLRAANLAILEIVKDNLKD